MKYLYKFNVIKEEETHEETTSKNDKGEEVITKTPVIKKVPVTFSIKRPNRKLYEDGELHYAVKLS